MGLCYNSVVLDHTVLPIPASIEVALTSAIDRLAAESLDWISDVALGEQVVALSRVVDRLEAEMCRRIARYDELLGPMGDGAASLSSWLRLKCRQSTAAATQHAEIARQLPNLPITEGALRSGTIGFHHAAAIARCAAEVGAD